MPFSIGPGSALSIAEVIEDFEREESGCFIPTLRSVKPAAFVRIVIFRFEFSRARFTFRNGMKRNIDDKGRAVRGGIAAVFLLAGGCLIPQAALLAGIFILVGLFSAFEALIGWCAIRACGFRLPF